MTLRSSRIMFRCTPWEKYRIEHLAKSEYRFNTTAEYVRQRALVKRIKTPISSNMAQALIMFNNLLQRSSIQDEIRLELEEIKSLIY